MITNIKQFKESIDISNKNLEVRPRTVYALKEIIQNTIKEHGNECDLNFIDTSLVDSMAFLFKEIPEFNGDISQWDTSNVNNMQSMFAGSKFNGDISKWNTSNVTNMFGMFRKSEFNGDISNWNVSNVINMDYMFYMSKFNGDISNWDVSKINNRAKYIIDRAEYDKKYITKDYIIKRYNLDKYSDDEKDKYIDKYLNYQLKYYEPDSLMRECGIYNTFSKSELENNNKIPKWYSDILNKIKK